MPAAYALSVSNEVRIDPWRFAFGSTKEATYAHSVQM
jgi:hypothetical protein